MRYRNIIDGRMNLDLKKSKLDHHMKEKKNTFTRTSHCS